ncbi:DUF4214 domain-containing protein [Ideonella sp. BN130291]|uniref:DUF4214 domain-containing protein n=1 Tax=Ideonella sp. BN130291 TaxID=3112940 RepID=UPI002E265D4E|nr:DUF4214 domain-containing protein [Ideonella sp. BN130291]
MSQRLPPPDRLTLAGPAKLSELLALHDESFVRAAYLAILGRPADPGGLANYLSQVRSGIPKLEIAAELATSAEARRHAAALEGLEKVLRRPWLNPHSMFWRAFRRWRRARSAWRVQAHLNRIENELGALRQEGLPSHRLADGYHPTQSMDTIPAAGIEHLNERARMLYGRMALLRETSGN